jgi:membrane protein insertase Oxa1/YidC/SpoIIIJ
VLWQGQGVPADSALGEVFRVTDAALEANVPITDSIYESVTLFGMNLRVSPSEAIDFSNILGSLPYIILILIIVAAGFYQQVQTTRKKPSDNGDEPNSQMQGMQNAMKIMPVVFGFISWNLVAGLGIYFATSNLFRVGQQALILRIGKDDGDGKPAKNQPDEPSDDSNDELPKSAPSENASKKRNRRRKK